MQRDTRFQQGVSGNDASKWKPGQSGNPSGKSRLRSQFEQAFNDALITQGGPGEAAELLWEAARRKEPWAIQELCRRFAPETASLKIVSSDPSEGFNYEKLTDEQLHQLHALLEAASEPPTLESRNGSAESA